MDHTRDSKVQDGANCEVAGNSGIPGGSLVGVDLVVRKRDGRVVPFEQALIVRAMAKAFCADRGLAEISLLDDALLQKIEMMTQEVV